jgi:hypothetical protein
MRRPVACAAAGTVFAALVVGPGTAALAAGDTTPPTLNLPASATFVPGTTIGDSTPPNSDYNYWTFNIPMRVTWTATDASGICGYDVAQVPIGAAPHPEVSNSLQTAYQADADDYNGDQGGGSLEVYSWRVTAHDCAGRVVAKQTRARPTVYQEDGRAYERQTIGIGYAGSWAASTCSCWSGDGDRNSRIAGAKATITATYTAGQSVALVMEKAPNRGAAQVLVDGVQKATVDTYAAATTHRSVVWNYQMPVGRHTVQIVNAGTAGRPRIDLDAVLLS